MTVSASCWNGAIQTIRLFGNEESEEGYRLGQISAEQYYLAVVRRLWVWYYMLSIIFKEERNNALLPLSVNILDLW